MTPSTELLEDGVHTRFAKGMQKVGAQRGTAAG